MDFINRQVAVNSVEVAKASCRDPALYPSMRCEWCGTETGMGRGARECYGAILCVECVQNYSIVFAIRSGRRFVQ